ncbi:hypothetical protein M427DRAFT_54311 [Gonapodya prolifera JEL478]|uniref:Formate/nitrite transporter n=1 Tax=Gonapodya prolifera (strain JEL478) TaxID=1344416 RepID=A0A139AMC2_GONPJ|nr:hypothetical protein M427DRAFT_54311 [Gonapodya prolifera JEL478]|eukprot:KXS17714.1 hypothetical protein M427DRAFT_54311 [Gonapodya prolifera JEL478]
MGLYKSPHEATQSIVAYGVKKGRQTLIGHVIVRSFLAGAFIAFGGLFAVIAGGGFDPAFRTLHPGVPKLLYGFVFPVGLVAVVLEGGELFTSNIMYLTAAVLERRASLLDLLRNWILSWVFNFAGALFVAYFLTFLPDILSGASSSWGTYIISIGHKKVSADFAHLMLKGIGCNWLVCLAVCFAITAESVEGKILGIYLPIWTFVTCGFEHSVANMFFIPLAMLYSPDSITTGELFSNLLPVTIGNIIGGAVFVALPSWYLLPSSGPFAHASDEKPVPLLPMHDLVTPWHGNEISTSQGEMPEHTKLVPPLEDVRVQIDAVPPTTSALLPVPPVGEAASPLPLERYPSAPAATPFAGNSRARRPSYTVSPPPIRTGLAIGLSTQALGMRSQTWGHAPGSAIGQAVVPTASNNIEFWDGFGTVMKQVVSTTSRGMGAASLARAEEKVNHGEGDGGDDARLVKTDSTTNH